MSTTFDADAIEKHGWRQGAVLGPALLRVARERAPSGLTIADDNWLIVTSHDCDVVNDRLEKEPTVEVLRGEAVSRRTPDKQQVWGRNPRVLQLEVDDGIGATVVLSVKVHERWTLPREVLSTEPPARVLGDKERRLIAEWLAKRYIRAAFPTAFDGRWRAKLREWTSLLEKHSRWVQGVYLRLSTLRELDEQKRQVRVVRLRVDDPPETAGRWRPCEREAVARRFHDRQAVVAELPLEIIHGLPLALVQREGHLDGDRFVRIRTLFHVVWIEFGKRSGSFGGHGAPNFGVKFWLLGC